MAARVAGTMSVHDGQVMREVMDAKLETIRTQIDGICKSTEESKRLMEIRLAEMNRMREQLDKQADTFATKDLLKNATDAIDKLESWKDKQEGVATQKSVWVAYAVSAAGLVIGLVGLLHSLGV